MTLFPIVPSSGAQFFRVPDLPQFGQVIFRGLWVV